MRPSEIKTIVWLYEDDHRTQPFICLARDSLVSSGYIVRILDGNNQPACGEGKEIRQNEAQGSLKRHRRILDYAVGICGCMSVMFRRGWMKSIPGASRAAKFFWYCWTAANAVKEAPDVIVATGIQGAAIGWVANSFLSVRMVYYPLELYGEQHNHLRSFWKRFECWFLSHEIDALITQNEPRAKIYVNEKGARVQPVIVHNYKRRRLVEPTGKLRKLLSLEPSDRLVLYEGLLGRGRWLDKLAMSAAYLPSGVRLVFMGKPTPWWIEIVEPIINKSPLAGRVLVAPWVDHSELLSYVADADVGVIIYDDSVRNNYYCEPGKLSDYVIAGLPVIAPDFPTIEPVLSQRGLGCAFNSSTPEAIARSICDVLEMPKEYWRAALEVAREEMVWETQYPALQYAIIGGVCK